MQLLIQSGDLGPKWFHVALRAIVLLAASNELLKSNVIAETLGEDATFVRKILAKLAEHGYVQTNSGRYGGYRLNKAPAQITMLEIYSVLGNDNETPYWSVPSTGSERFISMVIAKAEKTFQSVLADYTIQDILDNRS
ncbi:RrF2 family transcriptional regulator [Lysinibacillus sp. NPDC097195]|uniref:RrF2 family transcriptional regulator n=1 Tax=Lysinibacillus sp. NPDC097195 TaxID=3364141 RepID=UPI0037F6E55A